MTKLRLDEMLDDVKSKSSRSATDKFNKIFEELPEEEAERVRQQIAEKDIRGYWIRPHAAVAQVFQNAGYSFVTKSTVERYRSKLNEQ